MPRLRPAVLLALVVAGCGKTDPSVKAVKPAAPSPPTPAAPKPADPPPPVAPPPPAPPVDLPAATAAATKLLAALNAGTADPAAVSPAFQAVLAGGDTGRAGWLTEQFLRGFAGKVNPAPPAVLPVGADGAVLAVVPPTPTAGRVVLRLGKAGPDWQATWLHQAPAGPVPDLVGDPTVLGTKFAAAAFVEPALANLPRLAEAALSPAGRSRVAPPLGNDPLGFSRGTLSHALRGFAAGATGYTLTGTGPALSGDLLGPRGGKRAFTLTLAPGPDGGRVDDFDPR